ncbi:aldehyde dehydrogenase [Peziza echinospora]|nr:aldehyde dehydrogenase [Peziza echinospora]
MSSELQPLVPTPIEAIPSMVAGLRESFYAQAPFPLEWRKRQLRQLYWGIEDNTESIVAALKADLRKPEVEAHISEIATVTEELLYMLKNLDEWSKDEYGDMEMAVGFSRPIIRKEPMGVILIIGAFNFPLQLVLSPLIGAIAAGNTALIKPSESSPATAVVVTRIVEKYLDNNCYKIVNGAVDETKAVLKEEFDKICFTGSGTVGRIVAEAAAKHLTPCILELGGINPAIVTKNANIKLAAKRIAWGRALNSGQVCAAPGYILCHPEVEQELVADIAKAWKALYPNGVQASGDIARMNNNRSFNRVKSLLQSTKGEILLGGNLDETDSFIEPTLVKVDSPTDPLLRDEAFGPIIALLTEADLDRALITIRTICATPLAVYIFTNDKKEQNKLLEGTRSGGVTINDVLMHVALKSAPFGGVGQSGYGNYTGKASFDAFVHRRSVVVQANWMEKLLAMRYPPYTAGKLAKFNSTSKTKPNFDRNGNVKNAWIGLAVRLGGRSIKAGLARWALMLSAVGYYLFFVASK